MTASVVLFEGRSTVFEPNRSLTLEAAKRRSKLVGAMRVLLVLAILALGGSVGFFIISSAINPPPAIDPSSVGSEIRMVNPRFTGRDSGGTPYVITAQSAERPESGSDVTELLSPRLDFSGEDAPASIVQAARGVFDQTARTLDLLNGVSFATDNGYRFESEQARVYVDEGRVVGDEMIMGAGPLGSIRAQSFEIRDSGDRVVFSGDVVARLYPDRPETPASPDGFPGATFAPDGEAPASRSSSAPRVEDEVAAGGADPAMDASAPPDEPDEAAETP